MDGFNTEGTWLHTEITDFQAMSIIQKPDMWQTKGHLNVNLAVPIISAYINYEHIATYVLSLKLTTYTPYPSSTYQLCAP